MTLRRAIAIAFGCASSLACSSESPNARAPEEVSSAAGEAGADADDTDRTMPTKGPLVDGDVAHDAATVEADTREDAFDGAVDSADGADGEAGADGGSDASPADAGVDADDGGLGVDCTADAGHPVLLACTGLYRSWPSKALAPDVRAYEPGLHLWTDGLEKSRWIQLPPGAVIDTSDMDEWRFPVGTKVWKEFRMAGVRIETRFMQKRIDGSWFRTTYRWSTDEATATELTTGELRVNGTTYEVPTQDMCQTCHLGRNDNVLGFEAVTLTSPAATGLTMSALVAQNLVTQSPATSLIVPGNATESAALGWLHANCGISCHSASPSANARRTGLFMRLEVATMGSVQTTQVYATAVNVASSFQPSPGAGYLRIRAGNAQTSAIPFRAGYRDTGGEKFQMPPIATHVVDTPDVQLLRSWINAMTP